jgi:DNA-binding transcriptional MerR regulator
VSVKVAPKTSKSLDVPGSPEFVAVHGLPEAGTREYRIDELARLAGTTVRNVRAYQDRGLLPPSRREGRVALYSNVHLARMKVIVQLLERGYTLANIRELVSAWESGQNVGDLLGLEAVIAAPWTEEPPTLMSVEELTALFGEDAVEPELVEMVLQAGLIEVYQRGNDQSPDIFLIPNPRLLRVGAELVAAGIPLQAVLRLGLELRDRIDEVARSFVDLVVDHVFVPVGEPIPASEVPRLTEVVARLRPLAARAVDAELAESMERHVQAELRARLARLIEVSATSRTEVS